MQTFTALLERRIASAPTRTIFRFLTSGDVDGNEQVWTYRDLERASGAVAAALRERVRPGERAQILCPAGLDFVAAFIGCLRAGVIAVPMAPPVPVWLERNLRAVRAIARDAGAAVVLTTSELMADLSQVHAHAPEVAALPWLAVDTLEPAAAPAFAAAPGDVAFLQYTSGSTGDPKGVVVTHANLLANQVAIARAFGHRLGQSSGVSWLPLFHDMGLIGGVVQPIYFDAAPMTLLSPAHFLRRPVRWLRAISTQQAVTSGGPDFAFELCCDRVTDAELEGLDLSGWEVAFSGAMPVRRATLDRFAERFGSVGFRREAFLPCYGLAESTLLVSGARATREPREVELTSDAAALASEGAAGAVSRVSCGLPAEGHEVRIVDPATREEAPPGRVGAIWVRGPSVASGYWGKAPFDARLASGEGPFLDTGDLGVLDERGAIVVAGRAKDLLIVRGRNVHPADVEATAEEVDASIRSGGAAVFAVEREGREESVVVLEARGGDLASLAERVRAEIALRHAFSVDHVVCVRRGALLRTSSGKIRRAATRDAWLAGALPVTAHLTSEGASEPEHVDDTALLDVLLAWMREHASIASPRPDVSFVEQGLDSLQLASLASELEARLGVEVPVERFYAVTPEALAEALEGDALARLEPERADTAADLALDPSIAPSPARAGDAHPVLLVTGVTGFLGAFLLSELAKQTDADLLCFVRAPDPEAGFERVRANLKEHGVWHEGLARRLRIQPSDLAAPRLGLTDARWARLAGQITAVYHCGAHVHWGMPYAQLRAANVVGTAELARLACDAGGVPFHFVSSLGVFPLGISPRDSFEEDDALLDGENLDLGYFQTKWVAERQLRQARERGLPVTVYRPGFIGAHSASGRASSDQRQLFGAFLAGCLRLGVAPDVDKVIDIVPVDDVARAIVSLSLHGKERAYNLLQERPLQQRELYAQLRARGYALKTAAYPLWRSRLLELDADDPNPLTAFQGYYRLLTPARMRRTQVLLRESVPIAQQATRATLDRLGVRVTPLDGALIDTYLDALIATGEAPPPSERLVRETVAAPRIELVDYEVQLDSVRKLYDRATAKQWRAAERIDWGLSTDPENPLGLPDDAQPLHGSDVFRKMTPAEKVELRCHVQAWQLSQFLHGEQGALLCASQIVQHAPTLEARLFAGAQVADEARHVEVFDRLLSERFQHRYPITPPLARLLDDVLSDSRWDVTYLGMQVLIEGLALAAFAQIRDQSSNQLARTLNAYVMEDEARHVAFGRLVLADYYPQLTQAERDEREELVVEATYLLRDRFDPTAVWEALGLPAAACEQHLRESGILARYRQTLFSRIVPTVKAIHLFGPRVQSAYAKMGLLGFANVDLEAMHAHDERVAQTVGLA